MDEEIKFGETSVQLNWNGCIGKIVHYLEDQGVGFYYFLSDTGATAYPYEREEFTILK